VSQYVKSEYQRVLDAAARKGVALDIRGLATPAATPEEVAAALRVDLAQVVVSVVFVAPHPDGSLAPVVCLVSGRNRVDECLLAAVLGESSVRRATAGEVHELTGFTKGSVPPIGHGRGVRMVMDQDLGAYEWLWAPAGSETAMLRISPGVLRVLSNAFVTPLAETSWLQPAGSPALEARLSFDTGSNI
jgi:prolyl-tRNA editing enzyme YbaK/EbsC (Cys-tRNA(Pro) deacylase)